MNRRKFKLSSTLLAVLIASLANAADTSSWGHGYAFLYRSYSGAKPAWVSAHTGNINHQANTDVIEVKRPFHLGSTIFTVFDGNGSLAGISPITTRDANGRTSFTI